MTELTILMPCLNEAETLATCITKATTFLEKSHITGEILIADNGSTDGSVDIARGLGARVVEVSTRGYGAALKQGIREAKGRFVIMGDADDSYDFTSLASFVERLRAGEELVMGNRFSGGISRGAMPLLNRYLGNPVLSFLGRLFYRVPIGDFHCGLRGFNRQRILDVGLTSTGMEFASEMVVKAHLQGLRITEVPTTLSPDGRSRRPHLRPWSDGWRHLKFLLLYSPRWLFLYPGLAAIILGLVLILGLSDGTVALTPTIHLGVHSLVIGCFLLLIGVQSTSFALIARRYAAQTGMLPTTDIAMRWLGYCTVERTLVLAILLILGGAVGLLHSIWTWVDAGLGDLEYAGLLRPLMLSGSAVVVGLQLAFTAFLGELIGNKPTVKDDRG